MSREVTSTPGVLDLPLHFDTRVLLNALPGPIFTHLDDHRRLSDHMTRRSWVMAGSRMEMDMDADEGRAVGSKIRLRGRVLGISLGLEETVIERSPPVRKVWRTTTPPRLLVMGPYRMGFEITPQGTASLLTVFIDYALPDSGVERWLGRILGPWYARWCTRRMAHDAVAHFRSAPLAQHLRHERDSDTPSEWSAE